MDDIETSDQPPHPRVGLAYNLKHTTESGLPDDEAEYDDISTVVAIERALEYSGCQVELMEATDELPDRLRRSRPDIVFNIAEGRRGRAREAQVPSMCNFYGIPFTGSDETTLCVALDKALTKRLLATHRIRTPKYKVARAATRETFSGVPFPVIVKPNAEGSSKGIGNFSVAENRGELNRILTKNMGLYRQDMLVEEYVDGREFTVGILGNGPGARVFPPMEIVYRNRNRFSIYSFEVKKDYQAQIRYECPADIDADTQSEIMDMARGIYTVLECRDFARIDFRLSRAGRPYFIEINPLPGLAPGYSDFPMLAGFCGMDYDTLVCSVLDAALKRYGLPFSLKAGDGHE